jgi:hypothetical protein
MLLQSRALKAVDQAAESGEDHPLETCGLHRSCLAEQSVFGHPLKSTLSQSSSGRSRTS